MAKYYSSSLSGEVRRGRSRGYTRTRSTGLCPSTAASAAAAALLAVLAAAAARRRLVALLRGQELVLQVLHDGGRPPIVDAHGAALAARGTRVGQHEARVAVRRLAHDEAGAELLRVLLDEVRDLAWGVGPA